MSRKSAKVAAAGSDLMIAHAIAGSRATAARNRSTVSEGTVERLRAEYEAGLSTAFRNRRQVMPHLHAAGLFVVNAMLQVFVWILHSDAWTRSVGFLGPLAGTVVVAFVVVACKVSARWRARAVVAVLAAGGWLMWAAEAGISWMTTGMLMCGYYLLAARWWKYCRHDYPDGPPASPAPKPATKLSGPARDDIAGLWQAHVDCKNGALPGSYLHSQVIEEHREAWTVELMPGQQSLDKALANLDRIQTGLHRPQEELILEPHPSRDPAQLLLTVVTKSPIKDAVLFDGPQYFWDAEQEQGWIESGWYADGNGRVRVALYAPNSARHIMVFGGQGSGKTALMNSIAVSAKASGHTVIWYLDGQNGTSSPQLLRYADWAPTGSDAAEQMLEALEQIFAIRGLLMQAWRVSGLSPSPQLPGLVVFIDECHKVFDKTQPGMVKRWVDLASMARKLCVSFVVATQHPELASFGDSDKLRSLLQEYTTLLLRTKSPVASNILRLQVDPSKLPTMPGYGYLIAGEESEGVRSAPFRADFLDDKSGDADAWFERFPGVPLDKPSAKAAGPEYHNRAAIKAERQQELDTKVEALMAGTDIDAETLAELFPTQREPGPGAETGVVDGPLELAPVVAFPGTIPGPGQPIESTDADTSAPNGLTASQVAVYTAVAAGGARAADVASVAGLQLSQTYKLLGELVDAGHIAKAGHGRFLPLRRPAEPAGEPTGTCEARHQPPSTSAPHRPTPPHKERSAT
ncbi:zonular occludens toxin domain-containing protein [Actinopolymorpha sp. B11F2]|uniref:ATP-binding protein n=1 Tax=Actinopolymorpha sp. B11F2 TaxID=3160862 RepID=UPI0032E3DBC6